MTENEAISKIQWRIDTASAIAGKGTDGKAFEDLEMAIHALSEIQQYRAYKEIFESHFSEEALKLLSDKEEFCKWLERGKWIAKRCVEINRELEQYKTIGTIEEFKALKDARNKDCF